MAGNWELSNVLLHLVCVCVFFSSTKALHIPLLLGEVPIANVGGHWNKKQGEQAHKTQTTSPSLTESWGRVIWERTG